MYSYCRNEVDREGHGVRSAGRSRNRLATGLTIMEAGWCSARALRRWPGRWARTGALRGRAERWARLERLCALIVGLDGDPGAVGRLGNLGHLAGDDVGVACGARFDGLVLFQFLHGVAPLLWAVVDGKAKRPRVRALWFSAVLHDGGHCRFFRPLQASTPGLEGRRPRRLLSSGIPLLPSSLA